MHLVKAPPEEHFVWREITYDLPHGPKLNPSVQCAFCGEGVMEQRASVRDGRIACPECVEQYDKEKLISWDPDILFLDEGGYALVTEDYKKNPAMYRGILRSSFGQSACPGCWQRWSLG
ncbi:hypothetical protein JCM17380_45860 [Desulfosporosinus burensis]